MQFQRPAPGLPPPPSSRAMARNNRVHPAPGRRRGVSSPDPSSTPLRNGPRPHEVAAERQRSSRTNTDRRIPPSSSQAPPTSVNNSRTGVTGAPSPETRLFKYLVIMCALLFVPLLVFFFIQQSDASYFGGEPAEPGSDTRPCFNGLVDRLHDDFHTQRALMRALYPPGSFRSVKFGIATRSDCGSGSLNASVVSAERAFHQALFSRNPSAVPFLSYFSMGALPMNEGPTFTLPWCVGLELRCGTDDGVLGLAQFALDFPFADFGGAPGPTHMAARVQIDRRAELTDLDCHFAKTAAVMRRIDIDRVMYWMRGALAFWALASFCGLGVVLLFDFVSLEPPLDFTQLISNTRRSMLNYKGLLSFAQRESGSSSRAGAYAIFSVFAWAFLPHLVISGFRDGRQLHRGSFSPCKLHASSSTGSSRTGHLLYWQCSATSRCRPVCRSLWCFLVLCKIGRMR
eukprot:TRINITY_DN11231_c0_g1_i4.p1 TRINITY_DN11231_c0_g1~~TRINITY_DN11231_c0_g1_i4.p1  ORF type:complete len:457 (-),score=-50.58 TRINITY_DN11231_c0_g1_i4:572-1942(-)